jgi:hypothetical protein
MRNMAGGVSRSRGSRYANRISSDSESFFEQREELLRCERLGQAGVRAHLIGKTQNVEVAVPAAAR